MTSYEASAQFYDAVMGDRGELAAHLQRLIDQRCPGARAVLEIACGTGSILEQLRPRYEVTGLISPKRCWQSPPRRFPTFA
jgi:ubiquinone/menaquinone biosynthesis C-methylase UbiE